MPAPICTQSVLMPEELRQLIELLAMNAHENWARQRISEGWRYGPCRDDARKEHPGLVPYEQLSDSEKEYDRITAVETLRVIIKLGYLIIKEP
ncbi:MAG TPA: RyR domain-containing protein [Pyrinomonadaceae bacterium]|nr:RyR domain-containing protein [Pyrinomonadaceae bacterium]